MLTKVYKFLWKFNKCLKKIKEYLKVILQVILTNLLNFCKVFKKF